MTSIINNPEKDFVTVSGFTSDEFLESIVRLSNEGYKLINGTAFLFGVTKSVDMKRPVDSSIEVTSVETSVDIQTEESVSAPARTYGKDGLTLGIVMEAIPQFDKDKGLLQAYGNTFGIKLLKTRSFDNMVKDLEKGLLES